MVLSGCAAAHDVAVTSFRVIDAPANFVRRKIDPPSTTTTTTTTTVASDAVTPGRTVQVPPNNRQPQRQRGHGSAKARPERFSASPTECDRRRNPKPSPSAAPRSVANPPASYPTAKIVPGKPGYVFSPYDPNGGYVDVNGFTPGSKVKDPYSGKIFLVP